MERADVLRAVMSQAGITQTELSQMSGVKQPSISQFLAGRTAMSDDMLDRLLSCMGYRLEVIRRAVPADLDRSHRRSWELHRALATHLDSTHLAEWTPTIRNNLDRLRASTQGEPHTRNLDRWARLIDSRDVPGIRRVMTGLDTGSIEMREVSPLGGLLPQHERTAVLAGAR